MKGLERTTKPFSTKRLQMRPFRGDDAREVFFSYARDPEVSRYLRGGTPQNIEETWAYLNEHIALRETGEIFDWAICLKTTGAIIGAINAYEPEEEHKKENSLELGYRLAQNHWGQGYVTEALRGVLTYLTALGYKHFTAIAAQENIGSAKVLKKVGFRKTRETTLTKFDESEQFQCDVYEVITAQLKLSGEQHKTK